MVVFDHCNVNIYIFSILLLELLAGKPGLCLHNTVGCMFAVIILREADTLMPFLVRTFLVVHNSFVRKSLKVMK